MHQEFQKFWTFGKTWDVMDKAGSAFLDHVCHVFDISAPFCLPAGRPGGHLPQSLAPPCGPLQVVFLPLCQLQCEQVLLLPVHML